MGDPAQLERIITNLVDNALGYARSTVIIHLCCADGVAELTVIDDGPGIPVADRQRIFDRFVRLDEHRARPGGGSGLGLALVHDLVRGHGGAVSVAESATGGAAFAVRLPLALDQGAGPDPDHSATPPGTSKTALQPQSRPRRRETNGPVDHQLLRLRHAQALESGPRGFKG